jgi:hypothetical protein
MNRTESRPLALLLAERFSGFFTSVGHWLGALFGFASQMLGLFFPGLGKKRKLRPWMLVRRGKAREDSKELAASETDIRRILERLKQLEDTRVLSERAVGFTGSGSDYFCDPREVEQIIEALVRQNPPFLHIAREAPSDGSDRSDRLDVEWIERDSEVTITEKESLFIPQVGVHHLESRRPPGYPIIRSAKTLSDLRATPMLYQAMPDDYLVSRLVEGAIPLLAYREDRHNLLFRTEERLIERTEHRHTRVPVEIETGGAGSGTRLMYMLFDRSTSLVRNSSPRGGNAIMELAIAAAMVRCDMGRPNARYYFRSFAERLDPGPAHPPFMAKSVKEKDELVGRLLKTNFSGEATNVVEALLTAADDIEKIMDSGELGNSVKPRICLLTDGRATIYRNVGVRLKKLGIELDTILIGKEAARNPELIRISSTVTMVDPELYRESRAA